MNIDDNKTFHHFSVTTDIQTGAMQVSAKCSCASTKEPAPHCNIAHAITAEMLVKEAPPGGITLGTALTSISWHLRDISPGDPLVPPEESGDYWEEE